MTTCRELSEMVGTIGEEFGFRSGGCSYVDRMAQPRVMWYRYKDPDGTERIDVRMSDYFDLHPDIIGLMVRLCMEKLKGRDSSETFRRLTEAVRDEAVADERAEEPHPDEQRPDYISDGYEHGREPDGKL